MTKLKWDREPVRSSLNSDYWSNPKKGFDKNWHDAQATKQKILHKQIDLGTHKDHDLEFVKLDSGPHEGKIMCKTCNKFMRWLPKGFFN